MTCNLHNVLKELRKQRNLTQTQVANDLHISQRAYSYYETGDRQPNIDLLMDMAVYFNISIDYLVGRYKEVND